MKRRDFHRAASAAIIGAGCGAAKSPLRILTKPELEVDLAERLELGDVTLVEQGEGRFTGTGVDSAGRVFELEVRQEARRRSWKTSHHGPTGSSSGEGSLRW